MIGRVAGTITGWGRAARLLRDRRGRAAPSTHELTHILLHQMAAFNSPVWFNVGFEEQPAVQRLLHPLASRTRWSRSSTGTPRRATIFRGGSGSGINLSNIRGSMEPLAKGGTASGPVSFMRGADSWAGTIKSGGKTRRAAKMVVLDIDHPDIREFIWCKAKEEDKAAALRDAGFDMSIDGDGFYSIQYQNANNSVRVTDEFMHAVEDDADWHLTARTTGEPVGEPIKARELMREIAEAAWRCADPGVQYDTTINQWHTSPNSGPHQRVEPVQRVHARRQLGLQPGLAQPDEVPPPRRHASTSRPSSTRSTSCCWRRRSSSAPSSYPTEEIGANARAFRQLGLGYANLGAYLMSNGMPYDSDEGRGTAAAITALMTGRAYRRSAEVAGALGPYERYAENREPHNDVMRMHRDASYAIPDGTCLDTELLEPPRARPGTRPSSSATSYGYRNAQATVLAPTGTISLPDGLRHDRRRARLLAGQVQGAGRRRADDDRQPHRAAGAADARLHRGAGRADRGAPRPSTGRSSAHRAWPTSTCRCSTSRSASARSRTWATSR